MANGKTTVSVSEANKQSLDDVAEQVFGSDGATYNATIGFLTSYYNNN